MISPSRRDLPGDRIFDAARKSSASDRISRKKRKSAPAAPAKKIAARIVVPRQKSGLDAACYEGLIRKGLLVRSKLTAKQKI